MRVTIAAVGRLKRGPEREIAERLLKRASVAGRRLGLSFAIREVTESRAGQERARKDQEADALMAAVPEKAKLIALDEGGEAVDSRAFAARLRQWQDDGVTDVVFAIGGADGHGASLLDRSDYKFAFGRMTWPHQLVRLMLAEQLYRSITILLGHPYHRG